MKYGLNIEENIKTTKQKWRVQAENEISYLKLEIALLKNQLQNNKNIIPIKNELSALKFELCGLKAQLQDNASKINTLTARNQILATPKSWDNASKQGNNLSQYRCEGTNKAGQKKHEFTPLFPENVNTNTNNKIFFNPFFSNCQHLNNNTSGLVFNLQNMNSNNTSKGVFNSQNVKSNNTSRVSFNPLGPPLFSTSLPQSSEPFGSQMLIVLKGTRTVPYRITKGLDYNKDRLPFHTRLHCITTMPEYEDQSLEELRAQDYLMASPFHHSIFVDYGLNQNGGALLGTVVEQYHPTWIRDPYNKMTNCHHSITSQQTYTNKSFEELRLEDSIFKNAGTFRSTEKKEETTPNYFRPTFTEPIHKSAGVQLSRQEEMMDQVLLELKKLDVNLNNVNCQISSMESHLSEIGSQVSVMDSRLSSVDMFVTLQRFNKNWENLESRLTNLENPAVEPTSLEETDEGKSFTERLLEANSLKRRSSIPTKEFLENDLNVNDLEVDEGSHEPLLSKTESLNFNQSELKKEIVNDVSSCPEDCRQHSDLSNSTIVTSVELIKPDSSSLTLDLTNSYSNLSSGFPEKVDSSDVLATDLSSPPVVESEISKVSNNCSDKTDTIIEPTEAGMSRVSILHGTLQKSVAEGNKFETLNFSAEPEKNDFESQEKNPNVENRMSSDSSSKYGTTPVSSALKINSNATTSSVSLQAVNAVQNFDCNLIIKPAVENYNQNGFNKPRTNLNVENSTDSDSHSKYATTPENSTEPIGSNAVTLSTKGLTRSSSECSMDDEFVVVKKSDLCKDSDEPNYCDQQSGEKRQCSFELERSARQDQYLTMYNDITEYLEVNLRKKKDLPYAFDFTVKSDSPSVNKSVLDNTASETSKKQTESQSDSSVKTLNNDSFNTFMNDFIDNCTRKTQSTPVISGEKQSTNQGNI